MNMKKLASALAALAIALPLVTSPSVSWGRGPAPTLNFEGLNGDIVGCCNPDGNPSWNLPSGVTDGVFRLNLNRNGNHRIVAIDLVSNDGLRWDTLYSTSNWALGVTAPAATTLLNYSNGEIDVTFTDRVSLDLHVEDTNSGGTWFTGRTFYVTVTYSDGRTKKGRVSL